jgi:hypothetical protein
MNSLGLILGAGIYVIIVDIAAVAGNAIWIFFIVSSITALFIGLVWVMQNYLLYTPKVLEYIFGPFIYCSIICSFN